MSVLDDIERSRVDVSDIIWTSDEELYVLDASLDDLYLLGGNRRICISFDFGVKNADFDLACYYVKKVTPDVMEKIQSVPEIVRTSRLFLLREDFRAYVFVEVDVRTPYQAVRVLYSLIAMFCHIGDGWVTIVDFVNDYRNRTQIWSFKTKYVVPLRDYPEDESHRIGCIVGRMSGFPLASWEEDRCQERFNKMFERIKR